MTTSAPPPEAHSGSVDGRAPDTGWTALRFRWWNLLLLVPLISILPFLFNTEEPTLGGLPFFYWFQLAVIPVGIVCTVTVHLMTRSADEEGDR